MYPGWCREACTQGWWEGIYPGWCISRVVYAQGGISRVVYARVGIYGFKPVYKGFTEGYPMAIQSFIRFSPGSRSNPARRSV